MILSAAADFLRMDESVELLEASCGGMFQGWSFQFITEAGFSLSTNREGAARCSGLFHSQAENILRSLRDGTLLEQSEDVERQLVQGPKATSSKRRNSTDSKGRSTEMFQLILKGEGTLSALMDKQKVK